MNSVRVCARDYKIAIWVEFSKKVGDWYSITQKRAAIQKNCSPYVFFLVVYLVTTKVVLRRSLPVIVTS